MCVLRGSSRSRVTQIFCLALHHRVTQNGVSTQSDAHVPCVVSGASCTDTVEVDVLCSFTTETLSAHQGICPTTRIRFFLFCFPSRISTPKKPSTALSAPTCSLSLLPLALVAQATAGDDQGCARVQVGVNRFRLSSSQASHVRIGRPSGDAAALGVVPSSSNH